MKLIPVHDKIVVKPIVTNKEEKTASGIILPDTANLGKLHEGEVVAAGEGIYSSTGAIIPIIVKVGDKILYGNHAQVQEYTLNGDDVVIMSQNEVLSILQKD